MRLFASIRPPEEVREHLVTALRPIRDGLGPSLRWTDPDQWHLTVAFYGERPDGSVDELAGHIAAAVATTDFPPHDSSPTFPADATGPTDPSDSTDPEWNPAGAPHAPSLDLHLRGAGSFSGRTLWIGVGGDVDPLRRLMAGCAHDPLADYSDSHAHNLDFDTDSDADTDAESDSYSDSFPSRSSNSHSSGSHQQERRRAHLTVARLRAREQGGRRDGRRNHRRKAWAGDRKTGRSRHGAGPQASSGIAGGFDGGFGGEFGRDLARPARHDGASLLHDVVHALSVYSGPTWRATEIELVSSRLGEGRSGGALHETVATIPLAPRH
ncbi:2'-5' RNA ligase family protein [Corynebacterium sp. NPDC060344]|uniref:2'-5' RNA ligase family protein n=1 Tax=Corynebacterium sp. NPDC060344 TaxID=3347101 RepID=UPI00365D7430